MLLYDYFRSSAAYRVRIALNLKGVAYQAKDVSLIKGEQRSAEHLAVNPQGFVPALDIGGGVVLTQSLAIIDWLDSAYPQPRLIPAEPIARARALAQAQLIAADVHPLNNLRVLKRLESQFGADQAAKDDWYRHWISEGLTALEAMAGAQENIGSDYLGGDAPGIADIFLVPQMFNARRFDIPTEVYPRLYVLDNRSRALPAFAAAHPDQVRPD